MKTFPRLLSAYFISQAGSHFLTLALSSHVLFTSGNLVGAALVFVCSYLPSVLVSARLGSWVDRRGSRAAYATNEVASIAATLACGWAVLHQAPLAVLCALLAGRSVFGFLSRALAMKWVKEISSPEAQAPRFKLFSLAFFLATALSGTLAAVVLAKGGIPLVIAIDSISYLLAAALILTLPQWKVASSSAPSANLKHVLAEIRTHAGLFPLFLWVVLSQAVFQGAYSILVTALPIRQLHLGLSGVGYFQLAASLGIIAGFVVLWVRPSVLTARRASGTAAATLLALLGTVLAPNAATAWASFFLMHVGYELLWLAKSAELFRKSPPASVGRIQFVTASLASTSMSAVTLLYAESVEKMGISTGVLAVLAVLAIAGLLVGARRAQVEVAR